MHVFRLFALFWLSLFAFAASASPLLTPLTTDQGLTQGAVQKLFIDRQGFLWVATANGLNLYDGTQVRQFLPSANSFQDLSIVQLLEDDQRRFWVGASNAGVFQVDKTKGTAELVFALSAQEFQGPAVLHDLLVEDEHHLLLAINRAVYRYDLTARRLDKLFEYENNAGGSPMDRIRQLIRVDRKLYIASFQRIFTLDLDSGDHKSLQLNDSTQLIRKMALAGQKLLVAKGTELFEISLNNLNDRKKLLDDLQVQDIILTNEHWLLATTRGLYQIKLTSDKAELLWRFSDSNLEIGHDTINSIVKSPDGGFWLASVDDGAYYWHPKTNFFQTIPIAPITKNSSAVNGRNAQTMALGLDQRLWVGNNDGIKSVDLRTNTVTAHPYPAELPNNFRPMVNRIYPDAAGNVWLRAGLGLHYFSAQQQKFLSPPLQDQNQLKLFQQQVLGIWYSPQQEFWFFNQENYYKYQPLSGTLSVIERLNSQLPVGKARKIIGSLPNRPELLFIGAADELWSFNLETGKAALIYQVSPYQPLLERFPHDMAVDQNNVLWMAFDGVGLLGFDLTNFKLRHQFNTGNLLLSNKVNALEQDSAGNLWFSSNAGLSRLDPNTLRIEHFTKKDGLPSNEFIFAASAKLADGDLAFGSNRGVTRFNPVLLQEAPQAPSIVITSIQALNQPATPSFADINGKTFLFDHQAQGLKIEFSSLNFRDQSKIRYKFWLEGKQELHYPLQMTPSVIFPELAAGEYQFKVQAISQTTDLASPVASINIRIQPAPWLSAFAIGSYGAIFIILAAIWQYNRRVNKRLLATAHSKVQVSEQRLKQALDAVNSGVWEWHERKNNMFAHRVHTMLGYSEELNPVSLSQHVSLIHPEDQDGYLQAWHKFLGTTERTFDYTYRMQHKAGHWLWFRDIGRVTEVDGTKAIRVIGTYSNITETRATKEKARLFGEAFQQTRDWVVLLDPDQRVIAANQSFTDVFGNMDEYLNKPQKHDLGISLSRRRFYVRLLAGMTANQHWQGEELVTSPDGTERPTLINVSAVGESDDVEFFVLVFTDITAQKEAEENLRYLANYDALTGLPNRSLLMDRIHHGIDQAKREQRSIALCFIDLDKFKQVNDSLGHDVGDLLLKQVAKRLTTTLRLTDTVARLGGDEFVVLLESYKDDNNVSHVARKMLKAIGEPMQLGNHTVSVSPSIGIAMYPEDAADARELLKHADVAMYYAKDSGRNNFQFFIEDMNQKAHMQLARETRIRSAWQRDEFMNYYQPIYDSRSNQMIGVEVLMRWLDEDMLVPPAEFIPLAEDLRLIVPMTQALLVRALTDLQQWHQAGFEVYVSVNLSPRHLEQEQLAIETAALLDKFNIPAQCLRFEVTESALMQDHQSAIATMLALSELGVQLALDDFGTGYSSLKYLKELPIDAIKIDRSFVKDIGIDRNDETIIEAMLSMANSLGMYCIAEGVETQQQLEFFTERQCYFIQGYLLGKPMTAEHLLNKMQLERPTA
ncbi:MAG: EAL domain-containing protein [Gammaproteobacteria bacterium]|nr:EAL domain-containing protein [Gammaproteobacteria bacterium]